MGVTLPPAWEVQQYKPVDTPGSFMWVLGTTSSPPGCVNKQRSKKIESVDLTKDPWIWEDLDCLHPAGVLSKFSPRSQLYSLRQRLLGEGCSELSWLPEPAPPTRGVLQE